MYKYNNNNILMLISAFVVVQCIIMANASSSHSPIIELPIRLSQQLSPLECFKRTTTTIRVLNHSLYTSLQLLSANGEQHYTIGDDGVFGDIPIASHYTLLYTDNQDQTQHSMLVTLYKESRTHQQIIKSLVRVAQSTILQQPSSEFSNDGRVQLELDGPLGAQSVLAHFAFNQLVSVSYQGAGCGLVDIEWTAPKSSATNKYQTKKLLSIEAASLDAQLSSTACETLQVNFEASTSYVISLSQVDDTTNYSNIITKNVAIGHVAAKFTNLYGRFNVTIREQATSAMAYTGMTTVAQCEHNQQKPPTTTQIIIIICLVGGLVFGSLIGLAIFNKYFYHEKPSTYQRNTPPASQNSNKNSAFNSNIY
ncbi:hypothetical protein SAMD00019534_097870, partial [Acytostelium subglobosum LB1]|uniref:hypothetical protein n=1 Tax=Acytostelium subglobosum LB1 TaxID=1410327 RepID=UPI0006447F27